MRCLDISNFTQYENIDVAKVHVDIPFYSRHRRFASSLLTVDLTHIDPRATCRHDPGSCEVRNAVCDNEAVEGGSQKPTYHCLCRPGSAAVAAGVCVPDKCTMDVAKVGGRIAYGELKDMFSRQEILKKCCEVGDKLHPPKAHGEHGGHGHAEESASANKEDEAFWTDNQCEKVTGPPESRPHCNDRDRELKPEQEYQESLDKAHDDPQKVRAWTRDGIAWYNTLSKVTKLEDDKEGSKVDEDQMGAIGTAGKEEEFRTHLNKFTQPKDKLEYKRRHLSSTQEWKNEMFAGQAGIMPLQEISGGSPNIRQQVESQDEYRLKFVLPDNRTADSIAEVGFSDLNPNLNADIAKLVQKVRRASDSKAAMGMESMPGSMCIAAIFAGKVQKSKIKQSRPAIIARWSEFLS